MPRPSRPYVGPRPYEEDERAIFFGREHEKESLLSLAIAHEAILVYGTSGCGKTSLLHAGLIPSLKSEGFQVLPVARMGTAVPGDPFSSRSRMVESGNRFVFNSLLAWAGENTDPQRLERQTLADFLAEAPNPADQSRTPRIAIFDQFEEFFTAHTGLARERTEFFNQLRIVLDGDPVFRVVISMREDYIAELDPYARLLSNNLRIRFRLERLREPAALEAVKLPLTKAGQSRQFEAGAAEMLVKGLLKERVETEPGKFEEVPGEFVEPVQLQVVCESLWKKLPENVKTITRQDLALLGDLNEALSQYYENTVRRTVKIGVGEAKLRRWFETILITQSGTRGIVFRGERDTGGIPNDAIGVLEREHLIRAEWRAGSRWYELSHDTFIKAVQESNRQWRALRATAEGIRLRLEQRAAYWVSEGRRDQWLLDEGSLAEAEQWLSSQEASDLGYSDALVSFIKSSRTKQERAEEKRQLELERARAEAQAASAIRLRTLNRLLAIMLVIVILVGVIAVFELIWARAERAQALRARSDAEKAELNATEARKIAEESAAREASLRERAEQAEKQALMDRDFANTRLAEALAARSDAELAQNKNAELTKLVPKGVLPTIDLKSGNAAGIDLSHHTGSVDWPRVVSSGVSFVFIKATQGTVFVDPKFNQYWQELRDTEIRRGAYHVLTAEDPIKQADSFIAIMGILGADDLPPALDIEMPIFSSKWSSRESALDSILRWLDRVEQKSQRKPVVYISKSFITTILNGDVGKLVEYPLWWPQSTQDNSLQIPAGWRQWTFWQYSTLGTVNGVPGNVDLNKFNGTKKDLAEFVRSSRHITQSLPSSASGTELQWQPLHTSQDASLTKGVLAHIAADVDSRTEFVGGLSYFAIEIGAKKR